MISLILTGIKVGICLLISLFLKLQLYIEYVDCVFISGFVYLLSRAVSDEYFKVIPLNFSRGISIVLALITGYIFLKIYSTKAGFQVLRIGCSLFWGYFFYNFAKDFFGIDNLTWRYIIGIGMAVILFTSHERDIKHKMKVIAEADEEYKAEERAKGIC